jgi:hypothetical protein
MTMNPKQYLIWFAGAACLCAAILAGICVIADPYRVFGTPDIAGINETKPRIYQQGKMAETHMLARATPRTLLLGNSRIQVGFDPDSDAFPAAMKPVFNGAFAGAQLDHAVTMLHSALEKGGVETIILGLDFPDFLYAGKVSDRRAEEAPASWRDIIPATLTISALEDSVATLLGQDHANGVTMRADGFDPLHENNVYVRRVGYAGLFAQKLAPIRKGLVPAPHLDFADTHDNGAFADLRALIELATGNKIHLVMVIHPYHAQFLDVMRDVGLLASFASWKEAVTRTIALSGADAKTELYDFSGYSSYANEPVPAAANGTMRWYWEPGHYKPALGDVMLAQMLRHQSGFGVELPITLSSAVR